MRIRERTLQLMFKHGRSVTLWFCLIAVTSLCFRFFRQLNDGLDTSAQKTSLVNSKQILVLETWKAEFQVCSSLDDLRTCAQTELDSGSKAAFSFPAKEPTAKVLSTLKEKPTHVFLTHQLSENDLQWLDSQSVVSLVFPRSVQEKLTFKLGPRTFETFGVGSHSSFTVNARELRETRNILVEMDISDLPWFGPADFPAVLAKPEAVDTYLSFTLRNTFAGEWQNVLLLVLALLLTGCAIILDHSTSFAILAFYVSLRAVRAFLSSLFLLTDSFDEFFGYIFLFNEALILAVLPLFVGVTSGVFKKNYKFLAFFGGASVCALLLFGALHRDVSAALLSADLWSGSVGAFLCFPLLTLGTLERFQSLKSHSGKAELNQNQFVTKSQILGRNLFLSIGVFFHASANVKNLFLVYRGEVRIPIDWRESFFIPILVCAALVSIGSVTKKMTKYVSKLRGQFDLILEVTKEMAAASNSVSAVLKAGGCLLKETQAFKKQNFIFYIPQFSESSEDLFCKYSGSILESGEEEATLLGFVKRSELPEFEESRLRDGMLHVSVLHKGVCEAVLEFFLEDASENLQEDEDHLLKSVTHSLSLTLQNIQALEASRRNDEVRSEFFSDISHELRMPLKGIVGIAEAMLEEKKGQLSLSQQENLTQIVASGMRLSKVVDDIHDFSQLKDSKVVLDKRAVGLREITEIVCSMLRGSAAEKNIILENLVSQSLPSVYADENRLQQILFGLIGNALTFTNEGRVSVKAKLSHQNEIEITVLDTGTGISKEKQASLFDNGSHLDFSKGEEGRGLGLVIVQKLIEMHDGFLKVESEPGIGSSFSFALLVAADEHVPEHMDSEQTSFNFATTQKQIATKVENPLVTVSRNDAGSKTIFVIDDDPTHRHMMLNYLKLDGHTVVWAKDAFEALTLIESRKPDLVLVDLMMPGMTGFEFCEKVRKTYSLAELPVLIMTGKNKMNDLVGGFHSGANDFLFKPCTRKELSARVRAHLDLSEMTRSLMKLRNRLELILDATKKMAAAHEQLDAVSVAIDSLKHSLPDSPLDSVRIILREGLLQCGHPKFTLYERQGDGPWVSGNSSSEGQTLRVFLNSEVTDSVMLTSVHYVERNNLELAALFLTNVNLRAKEDEEFVSAIMNSLAIALENQDFAEQKALDVKSATEKISRERELGEKRTALEERRNLLNLVSIAAQISDKINSPLLAALNAFEGMQKRIEQAAIKLQNNETDLDLRMLVDSLNRRAALLAESLASIQKTSKVLEELREKGTEIEATEAIQSAALNKSAIAF